MPAPWRIRTRSHKELLPDSFSSRDDALAYLNGELADFANEYEIVYFEEFDFLAAPAVSPADRRRPLKTELVLPRYHVAYFRDCEDDFKDLVARRLASVEGFSHLSRGQRYAVASVIFWRKAGRPASEAGRLVGWDAINRPVWQAKEFGHTRTWATTRDGGPADPRQPVRPYEPISIREEK